MENGNTPKSKPYGKLLAFGIFSAALYAGVFANANALTEMFSRGGFYAALPIATVFVFSYAHGTFASTLWSVLGINAKATRKQAAPAATKRQRPRATVNA